MADTLVTFTTNLGAFTVNLYADAAPASVQNFLNYIPTYQQSGNFMHRSVSNFIVQGGGYRYNGNTLVNPQFAPIANEYSSTRPNVERTIAWATVAGNPNSATNQFFFNMENNLALNGQNGGYAVFGRVVAGWDVVEKINALPIIDSSGGVSSSPFREVPVVDYSGGQLQPSNLVTFSVAAAGAVSAVATDGDDRLVGTIDADILDGLGGADALFGAEGSDTLSGGSGDDRIDGGDGDDSLYGGLGGNTLHGGTGQDLLVGDGNDDAMLGGDGDDELYGQNGQDTLDGGMGNDFLRGMNGEDTIYGGGGLDTLWGEGGSDLLVGAAKTDLLLGGSEDDQAYGAGGDDQIDGGTGNDFLRGQDGTDVIRGGAGLDSIMGDAGADTLYGDAGADRFVFLSASDSAVAAADIVMDFTSGVDQLDFRPVTSGQAATWQVLAAGGGYTALDIDIGNNGSVDMRVVLAPGSTVAAGDLLFT